MPPSPWTRSDCWHLEHLSLQFSGSVFHLQLIASLSDRCVISLGPGLHRGAVTACQQAPHEDAAFVEQVHRDGKRALRDSIRRREKCCEDENADQHIAAVLLQL